MAWRSRRAFGCLPCPVSTCRLTEWVWSLSWLRSGTKGLQRGLAAGAARRRGINGATLLIGVETRVKIHAFIGALPSEARPAESLERHDMPTCARPQRDGRRRRDGNYVYLPDLAWPGWERARGVAREGKDDGRWMMN